MHKTQFKGSVIVGHKTICGSVVQFKAWRFNIGTKNTEKEILVTEWKCSREFSTLRERWWYMSQYSIATALVCHSCTWMISGWHPVICNKVHPTNQFQIASCWKPHLLTKKKVSVPVSCSTEQKNINLKTSFQNSFSRKCKMTVHLGCQLLSTTW